MLAALTNCKLVVFCRTETDWRRKSCQSLVPPTTDYIPIKSPTNDVVNAVDCIHEILGDKKRMSIVNKRRIKVGYESSSLEWPVYQENPSKYCRTFHKSDLHDNYTGKTFHTYAVVVGLSCVLSTCPCAVKTEEHRVTSEVEREDTLYRI